MKTVLSLCLTFALVSPCFAQADKAKKPAATKAPATDKATQAAKPADAIKPAEEKPEGAKAAAASTDGARPLPMNARVDAIDAEGKSFTTNRKKDNVALKHIITDKTDIKNGGAAATFADIKVGDMVAGSRIRKSDTEFEVVKITKFGAPAKKDASTPAAASAPKDGEAKP